MTPFQTATAIQALLRRFAWALLLGTFGTLMAPNASAQVCQKAPDTIFTASNVTINTSAPHFVCTSAAQTVLALPRAARKIDWIIEVVSGLQASNRLVWGGDVYRRLTAIWGLDNLGRNQAHWLGAHRSADKALSQRGKPSTARSARLFGPTLAPHSNHDRRRNTQQARRFA